MTANLVSGFLAGVASLALVSVANADVQIRMKPGDQCWSYQGDDTRFYGDFAGDQSLTVAVVFQEANDHGGITTTAFNGEKVWVNGPNGYYLDGHRDSNPNDPFIHTEKPGRYIFNLNEHGTGSELPVFFQICAMSKDGVVSVAHSQEVIDDQTSCAAAVRLYDNEDRAAVSAVARYVMGVLEQLDRAHMAKGEVGILSAMSKDGLVKTSVTPIEMCRRIPTATLHSQIIKTYDGIRAAEQQMGTIPR